MSNRERKLLALVAELGAELSGVMSTVIVPLAVAKGGGVINADSPIGRRIGEVARLLVRAAGVCEAWDSPIESAFSRN